MNIITVVVTLVSALIGLVLGYFAISLKMKSAKETAELTLLNAEQEASNVRGRAEEQAEVILKTAERDRQTLKKE
ncbi:TPA: ribonuclease Y, partial [Streptococcus suis]|nr:ribonuclease Y [Streptococcus suis]